MHITDSFGYWFAGFTDGEGSFTLDLNPRRYIPQPRFSISLRDDDLDVLCWLKQELEIGYLYQRKKREVNSQGYSSNPRADFVVTTKQNCALLVELFTAYPLRSKKSRDFEIWAKAVDLWCSREWRGPMTPEKRISADHLLSLRSHLHAIRVYQSR